MRKIFNLSMAAFILAGCGCNEGQTSKLALCYDRPAEFFEETAAIGNGTLGAIIYGGVGEDKIALNDITLWTGEPQGEMFTPDAYKALPEVRALLDKEDYKAAEEANKKIQGPNVQYYQPLGTIWIDNDVKDATLYSRKLDISEAVASVSYSTETGKVEREYFASAPDSVIVIRLSAKDGEKINAALRYETKQKVTSAAATSLDPKNAEFSLEGYTAYDFNHEGKEKDEDFFRYDPERGIHFQTILRAEAKDGEIEGTEDGFRMKDCSEVVLLVSNVTSFNGATKDPVKEGRDYRTAVRNRIDKAAAKSYQDLMKTHVADYKALFDRVSLDLGETAPEIAALPTDVQLRQYTELNQTNPDLEELYFQYGRYLLISCSRTEGVPANLQGLWNEYMTPPWRCNYTVNINLEENYWPSETANLSEMHNSLLSFLAPMSENGKVTAKNYYDVQRGWCSGHNSTIWATTEPVGERNGSPQWADWQMGGAWLSTHIWEHWCFTMDKDFLQKEYPVLRGAAEFCLGWLIEKDGYLMTSPSTSPEAHYRTPEGFCGATLYGGTADLAFIRECITDARDAAKILGVDDDFVSEADSTLSKLLPYHIGSRGQLLEWYHDWEDEDWHHRHQSHLFGLFPGHQISVDKTPELAAACAKTLEIKGDKTTGWSTGWRVNLQARLRNSEMAYHIYRTLLKYISPDKYQGEDAIRGGGTYPNLFDAHSPFQIDGNFGGCAGVIEMLVQSSVEDGIVLLPALPEAWKAQGQLKGVRARGGYELDFSWKDGQITALSVKSTRPDAAPLHITCGDKAWDINTTPGSTQKVKI